MEAIPVIIARLAPGATVETSLLVVPSTERVMVSQIAVCNRGGVATTFRISVSPRGAATALADYLFYDLTIAANDTFATELHFVMESFDAMRVFAGSANLTFVLFGVRI